MGTLVGNCSTAWTTDGFVLIDLFAEDEDGEYDEQWLDGSVLLASIVPVRTEVMAGDFRLFNPAWLLAVQNREVEEVEVEPPVPSGLGRLTPIEYERPSPAHRQLRLPNPTCHLVVQQSPRPLPLPVPPGGNASNSRGVREIDRCRDGTSAGLAGGLPFGLAG